MPLTKKGKRILASMRETYGDDAEKVFYASANSGKIKGVHKVKDADGHEWTRAAHLSDNDTLLDAVTKHRDGYLTCEARVARTGTQRYRGYELGMPDKEHVTLYRPPEEVFARDSMRSMANKPVTLTHPKQMVDSKNWGKVAKGFSGSEVVRDGEYVRVPLMLTDAAAIEAFERGHSRELSVGYTTDIDWTAGTTPDGKPYDGVQRAIRGNHHALVPVARGGDQLRFGDAGEESQGAGLSKCPNCGAALTGSPMSCPQCGYDLKPTAHVGDYSDDQPRGDDGKWTSGSGGGEETPEEKNRRQNPSGSQISASEYDDNEQNWPDIDTRTGPDPERPGKTRSYQLTRPKPNAKLAPGQEKNFRMDSAVKAEDAASRGIAGEEGVMPIIKQFDGIPISFHDEASAALMEREFRNLQTKLADAGSDNFGGKKAKPFGKDSDDDSDDTEAKRKKVTAEDALKKDIETRDGEIAVLRKQLKDAQTTDAQIEARAAERITLLADAAPFLPKDFNAAGKSLAEIRRIAVGMTFTDAEMKDWTDDQVIGAFRTMGKVGKAAPAKGGAAALADGMTRNMRENAGYLGSSSAITDGEKAAETEYQNYVKRISDGYKKPFEVVRN